MTNWVFDNPDTYRTMSRCPDTVILPNLDIKYGRFPTPNLLWYWREAYRWASGTAQSFNVFGLDNRPSKYMYNIGTWTDPSVWTGWDNNTHGFDNLFSIVPPEVLDDARNNKALLVIDNLAEGFYTEKLYEFWHKSCQQFNLPPTNIIYLTSNELDNRGYSLWADTNNVSDRINIVGFCHFEYQFQKFVTDRADQGVMIDWQDHLNTKNSNSKTIKTFNCLNRVKRQHREFLFLRLLQEGLTKHGVVSHDVLSQNWKGFGIPDEIVDQAVNMLPITADDTNFNNNKSMQFNNGLYTNTWISIVTETHALEEQHNFFMSEKIWKPIHALHPFMVLGHKGTLAKLHDMGYQTFNGLIDERYDTQDFFPRVELIIKNLKLLHLTKDKIGWMESLKDTCIHNRQVFMARDFFKSTACNDILTIYNRLDT